MRGAGWGRTGGSPQRGPTETAGVDKTKVVISPTPISSPAGDGVLLTTDAGHWKRVGYDTSGVGMDCIIRSTTRTGHMEARRRGVGEKALFIGTTAAFGVCNSREDPWRSWPWGPQTCPQRRV